MGLVASQNVLRGLTHENSLQTNSSATLGGRKLAHKERIFLEKTWNFKDAGKSKTEVLPAGNYEFPFDTIIEGSMPESVEGLEHSWVVYRFKAEIGRKFQKDIVIRKPLRIVRTLDSGALELSQTMVRPVIPPIAKTLTTSLPVRREHLG